MKIDRAKFNEIIVADVMRGGMNTYKKFHNGDLQWTLHKGNKWLYKEWDKDAPCVTLEMNNITSTTILNNQICVEDVADYITNHELNFDKKKKLAQAEMEFCANNAWTRSGT